MRITITPWLAGLALCASMSVAAQGRPAADEAWAARAGEGGDAGSAGVLPALVGTWKSAPLTTPLVGEFEESVWGRGASSVRTVDLGIDKSGKGTLTVTTKVLDARGRAVQGPTSIETSRLEVGAPGKVSAVGTDHAVTVTSAMRRYPDDPVSEWPIEGLKVRLITRDDSASVEMRYDTPEGRGSFWETLTRDGKAPRPATSKTSAPAR